MPLAFSTGTSSHPKNTLQKRKFRIKVIVLLHILIPGVMLSSLKTINPWLSACDLAQPAPPDLQGSCSATQLSPRTMPQRDGEMLSCPMSCPLNQSSSDSQCLAYLDETRRNAICNFSSGSGSEWLKNFLGQIRLRHCCEYKIIESLSGTLLDRVLAGKEECYQIIDSLVEVDNLAARVSCEFTEVLSRYDCGQPYSVRFSCEDCKEAYRRWVCSSLVPFFNGTRRVRPCRSVCQAVEQKCPYFLPENRAPSLPTQYAGEPTFLCMDPNIPETGEQLKRSLYPEKDTCCVKPCGSPRDGLCIERGTKCEELSPYENATVEECNGTETGVSRVPNEDCPGPATHPSFKASATSKPGFHPFLVLLSALLGLQPNHHHFYFLVLLIIFHYYLYSFRLVHLISFFYLFSGDLTRRCPRLFESAAISLKSLYHLIKLSKLIFNYFKFNSNKWQYYFILISVNLRAGNGRKTTTTTPASSPRLQPRNGLKNLRSEKFRGHYKKQSIQILSNSAQKLKIVERRMLSGLKTKNENSIYEYLVIETITTHDCGISLNDNSSTINRLKVYSMILKILLIKILHCRLNYKRRERCNAFNKQYMEMNNCSSYLNNRLLSLPPPPPLLLLPPLPPPPPMLLIIMNNPYIRTNVVDKSICMFLHSSRSYKYVWYYIKKYFVYGELCKNYFELGVVTVSETGSEFSAKLPVLVT